MAGQAQALFERVAEACTAIYGLEPGALAPGTDMERTLRDGVLRMHSQIQALQGEVTAEASPPPPRRKTRRTLFDTGVKNVKVDQRDVVEEG